MQVLFDQKKNKGFNCNVEKMKPNNKVYFEDKDFAFIMKELLIEPELLNYVGGSSVWLNAGLR